MASTRMMWLVLTFASCFAVVGIPYWRVPYGELDLPGGLLGPTALFVIFVAGLCKLFGSVTIWAVIATVVAALVGVVSVRIGLDTAADPTTHNLLPFELLIALFVGAMLGAAGGARRSFGSCCV